MLILLGALTGDAHLAAAMWLPILLSAVLTAGVIVAGQLRVRTEAGRRGRYVSFKRRR